MGENTIFPIFSRNYTYVSSYGVLKRPLSSTLPRTKKNSTFSGRTLKNTVGHNLLMCNPQDYAVLCHSWTECLAWPEHGSPGEPVLRPGGGPGGGRGAKESLLC